MRRIVRSVFVLALVAAACTPPGAGDAGPDVAGDAGPDVADDAGPHVADDAGQTDAGGPDTPVVTVSQGALRGRVDDDVLAFLGVPYAAPPTGDRRFKPAVAHPAWDGERDASSFGPACPHGDAWGTPWAEQSEDCLTLNVWTKTLDDDAALPVMVWIHGGSFVAGTSASPAYNGAGLARDDVVVVSLNYRLGHLGFLAHPALTDEGTYGNQAVTDWVQALKWVRDHIDRFGGDPNNVTVFGESAGGNAVCTLLVSPLADGLFHRMLMQSGGCYALRYLLTIPSEECAPQALADDNLWDGVSAECIGKAVSSSLGCEGAVDEAACLRELPADAFVDVPAVPDNKGYLGGVSHGPIVDGVLVPQLIWTLLTNKPDGSIAPDLLIGTTGDEPTLFHWPDASPSFPTAASYEDAVADAVPASCYDDVLAAYPAGADEDARRSVWFDLLRDSGYLCGNRSIARAVSTRQAASASTYLYWFTHVSTGGATPVGGADFPLGAWHASENPLVFDSFPTPERALADCPSDEEWCCYDRTPGAWLCCEEQGAGRCYGPPEVAMSEALRAYWTSFAATGTPSVDGLPTWAAWSEAGEPDMRLESPPQPGSELGADVCPLWEQVWTGDCP